MSRKDSPAPVDRRRQEQTSAAGMPQGRLGQVRATYRAVAQADRRLPLVLAGTFLAVLVLMVLLGVLVGHPWWLGFLGLLLAVLATMAVYVRRANAAVFARIDGQLGAAPTVMEQLRGWTVTPAVAASSKQAFVHLVVGRGGIVLVGEGQPNRLGGLLQAERRKLARVVPDVPVTEIVVGHEEGQVPLRKLNGRISRSKRVLDNRQLGQVTKRLRAYGGQTMTGPRGYVPRGGRVPRG